MLLNSQEMALFVDAGDAAAAREALRRRQEEAFRRKHCLPCPYKQPIWRPSLDISHGRN